MATVAEHSPTRREFGSLTLFPLVAGPIFSWQVFGNSPPWIFMWAMAISVYAGLKWLSFTGFPRACDAPPWKTTAYLLLWPGMDAAAFLDERRGRIPTWRDLAIGSAEFALGLALLYIFAPWGLSVNPLLAGWIAMAGLIFVLHFGLFRLLSLFWRSFGIDAEPIMDNPVMATSLSDFWGRRWNRAFRDVSHTIVYKPLTRSMGVAGATMFTFLFSGVLHDLVISVPAHGGWGLPTAYFIIQGLALLFERSRWGKRLGLRGNAAGRIFAAIVVVAPVGLLFPPAFVRNVILPMLTFLQAV